MTTEQQYQAPTPPAFGGAPQSFPPPAPPAAQAPGVGPVVAFTALFGVLGAISASNRAKKAAAVGAPARPYWMAFGITLAVELALFVLMMILVVAGAVTLAASSSTVTSSSLERSIVQNGEFKAGDGTMAKASAATCTASQVDSRGAGTYRCMIDFTDQTRQSYVVTVDSNGKWVTDNGN